MRSWFSTTEVAAVPPGAELEARAEGAIRALDRGTIEMARWSGLAGASVRAVSLAEAFALADGTGIAIARVEVADARVAPLFAIPLEGGAPWRALDSLIRMGQSRDGLRGGRLTGLPAASEKKALLLYQSSNSASHSGYRLRCANGKSDEPMGNLFKSHGLYRHPDGLVFSRHVTRGNL